MPWKPPRHRPYQNRKEPRLNAHQRGYDRKHRNMREQELRDQPLCVYCLERGKTAAADVIDHITAMARGGAALDAENRQPLCRMCNAVKAATADKGLVNNNKEFGPLPRE